MSYSFEHPSHFLRAFFQIANSFGWVRQWRFAEVIVSKEIFAMNENKQIKHIHICICWRREKKKHGCFYSFLFWRCIARVCIGNDVDMWMKAYIMWIDVFFSIAIFIDACDCDDTQIRDHFFSDLNNDMI